MVENWRLKVFCPAFIQKSGRGPGAEPLDARRSARNSLLLTKRRRGLKGEPSPGVPPLRAPPRRPQPLRRRGAGGGRRKGSSRTPTPTAGGRRAVRRIICRESIPCPGEGRRNVVRPACTVRAGRRGRRPLQGWCDAVGSEVIAGKGRRGRRPLRVAARPGRVPRNLPGAGRGGVLVSFSGRRGRRPLQGRLRLHGAGGLPPPHAVPLPKQKTPLLGAFFALAVRHRRVIQSMLRHSR